MLSFIISTFTPIVIAGLGFSFNLMLEIMSVVNTSWRDCNVLLYNIKYVSKYPTGEYKNGGG